MTLADLTVGNSYTYADYCGWDFDERVELIKGRAYSMGQTPGTSHQRVLGDVCGQLWSFLKDRKCEVFGAPFDARLPRKSNEDREILTVLKPDICVVCDPAKLDKRGCLGAPDIVVEILCPGNNAKELKTKYEGV